MERASVCDNYRRRIGLPEGKLHGITHMQPLRERWQGVVGLQYLAQGHFDSAQALQILLIVSRFRCSCVSTPQLPTGYEQHSEFDVSVLGQQSYNTTAWRLPGSFRFKSSLGADIWTLTVGFCSMGNITDGCSLSWPSNVAAFTKSLTTQGLVRFYTCPNQPPSRQILDKGKSAKQLRVLCAEC